MEKTNFEFNPPVIDPGLFEDFTSGLLPCCIDTIQLHSKNNAMMVCAECKQTIKCFDDETKYKNYLRFCHSRKRKILAATHNNMYVVVFHAYEN